MCGVSGGYGPVPGYGGHAGDAFGGPNMGGPGQQYRGMTYPGGYQSSSSSMEPHHAGHFAGAGGSGPQLGTSISGGDTGGMQSVSAGRAGSTSSEDQSSAARSAAPPSDNVIMNTQQAVSNDGSQESSVQASMEGNHIRSAGPPTIDDNLGRQHSGMDTRPMYPAGLDGSNLRYGQPGMDVRTSLQKQMFGQMPSRSAPFMNMNGVAIRPGQLPFGPDGAPGRVIEGMGAQPSDMDSMSSRSDLPLVGQDGLQRRPGQSMPADSMFGRQGPPPPFGMDGPGGRLGPPSSMDMMMRRTGHTVPDDGTMNRSSHNANMDTRASMHGMPVRSDESCDDSFRQGPQMGPGNMPIRPSMENMPGRPLPQMGGMAEGMNVRPMQPQHPPPQGGMDVMQGRPGQMRMDAMERRGGIPEGVGPHSQHPGYGQQYPGYGSHQAAGHPGPPPSGFTGPEANATGDQMFRNHMPSHGVHADSRGPTVAPGSGSDSYRPGGEFAGDQRHFMPNGDVDIMRRTGDPSFVPKNFENGECVRFCLNTRTNDF